MSKLRTGLVGLLVVAGFVAVLILQNQDLNKAREENAALKQQLDQSAPLAAENERLSNLVAQAKSGNDQDSGELLRLRSEVGMLRRQTNEAGKLMRENSRLKDALASAAHTAAATPAANTAQEDPSMQPERVAAIARMNDAKALVLGMIMFAQEHQGQAPPSLDDAKAYVNDKLTQTNAFERVYDGPLQNVPNPSAVILIREPEAHQGPNGTWNKTYGFADGHVEIHNTPDGNFTPWEQQHSAPSSPSTQPAGQ